MVMELKKKRIIIWGAGTMAKGLSECFDYDLAEILCYVDSDSTKCFGLFQGKPVIAPENINTQEFDYVFISSVIYQNEILEQLKELGIDRDKIVLAKITEADMAKIISFITEKGMQYFSYIQNARMERKIDIMTARLGNPFNRSRHLYLKQYYEADAARFIAEKFIDGADAPGKQYFLRGEHHILIMY